MRYINPLFTVRYVNPLFTVRYINPLFTVRYVNPLFTVSGQGVVGGSLLLFSALFFLSFVYTGIPAIVDLGI